MAEEIPTTTKTPPVKPATPKLIPKPAVKKGKTLGKWFQKIPREILFSPGGIVLIVFALIMEILDWIPIPIIDNLWELPLELIFIVFLAIIVKLPLQSMLIPFIIERIPMVNDIVPTWFIRMFL